MKWFTANYRKDSAGRAQPGQEASGGGLYPGGYREGGEIAFRGAANDGTMKERGIEGIYG
jgi:hypothetical protein